MRASGYPWVLVIREDSLAVFFKGFPGVCVFAPQRGERLPRRDVTHLPAQYLRRELRVADEVQLPYGQMSAIVDFEPDGYRRVLRFLPLDSNTRFRVAQLIQTGANREGNPLERRWIGWFSKAGCELFVFEHFFDLFLREQPGARILHLGKKRPLLQMKNKSYVFLVFERLRRRKI